MDFDFFLVNPLSESFVLLRTAIETRLTRVLVAFIPDLLAVQVSYRAAPAYIDPPEGANDRPLRIDFVTKDAASLLNTFPDAVPPPVLAKVEEVVRGYLVGKPYLVSLISSRVRLDRRLCRIPTDWLRRIIPRLSLQLTLGDTEVATETALEHGDQHVLVDLRTFCDVPRYNTDQFPEMHTVATMYAHLRERVFSELCELHSRGALVEPPVRLEAAWGLVPTLHKGIYIAAWQHSALVEPYDGMLGLLTHLLESEAYADSAYKTVNRYADHTQSFTSLSLASSEAISQDNNAIFPRVMIHLRCSPNRHARHHVAVALRHLTGEAPQFRDSLVYIAVRGRTEALQAVTAVQTFEKIHQGAVEVRHSATRAENLWPEDAIAAAVSDGKLVRYIDLDMVEGRYATSIEI